MAGVVLKSLKINEVGGKTIYLLYQDGPNLLNTGILSKKVIKNLP